MKSTTYERGKIRVRVLCKRYTAATGVTACRPCVTAPCRLIVRRSVGSGISSCGVVVSGVVARQRPRYGPGRLIVRRCQPARPPARQRSRYGPGRLMVRRRQPARPPALWVRSRNAWPQSADAKKPASRGRKKAPLRGLVV